MQIENLPSYTELLQGFAAIPFNKMLGLQLDSLTLDTCSMRFDMKDELVGNFMYGILHGGVISSVLDMAGGVIVMATAASKHPDLAANNLADILAKCSTIDLQVSYLRPGKGTHFTATGSLIKSGNRISFTRMELKNEKNLLVAIANGTYGF